MKKIASVSLYYINCVKKSAAAATAGIAAAVRISTASARDAPAEITA